MKSEHIEEQYVIRLFRQSQDIIATVRLRIDIEAVDQAGNNLDETAFIETLNRRGHDPEKDRWVVESPDNATVLIGHAWVRIQSKERTVVYMAIHPRWRRKGLGTALLDRTLARAKEHGASHVTAAIDMKNEGSREFLYRHGFTHAGDNRFMQAAEGIHLDEPHWPSGYSVRNYAEVQNLSILVEAFNRSYGDMWGHEENTSGAMTEEYLAKLIDQYPEGFPPEGIFIAFAPDGKVAGVCLAKLGPLVKDTDNEREKIVDSPGVVPEYRHMKLQHPLTLTATHWLRSHGPGPINLESYGDREEAIEIYCDLGFVLKEHYVEYCYYLT